MSTTAMATFSLVGVILLLGAGAGAVHYLSRAGTDALATTARLLITTGLAGLVVLTVVVVARASRPPSAGRRGRARRRPPRLVPIPTADPDAELVRLLDDDRFADISKNLRGSGHQVPGRRVGRRRIGEPVSTPF